jgi:hypothetical protein
MRLVFHWTVKITFSGDVQLYMKGIYSEKNPNRSLIPVF